MITKLTMLKSIQQKLFKGNFLINSLFFLLIVIGAFFVAPPTGNVGDQATENILIQAKLIEYHNSGYKGTFSQFADRGLEEYHYKQLHSDQHPSYYGLSDKRNTYFVEMEQVKILQRLIEYAIHCLTFRMFAMEITFIIVGFVITLLTFIFGYLFGRELLGNTFGTIVAVVVTSNVYFSQLVRSSSEPQVALYPLLFFMCFFFLFRLHHQPINKKIWSAFGLSFSLSLLILNGYPNTTMVLLPFLILFAISLRTLSALHFYEDKKVPLFFYPGILCCSALIYFFLCGLWGYLTGESFLNHISLLSVRSHYITSGHETLNSFLENPSIITFKDICSRIFSNVFLNSPVLYPAHMPGTLVHQSILNPIEGLLLIIGIVSFLKGILIKRLSNYFLIFIAFFFILRAATNDNFLIWNRNFDYYFLVLILVSYGLYSLVQSRKIDNWLTTINLKTKWVFIGLLMIAVIINYAKFNRNFVYKFNENLGDLNGSYDVRQLLRNEVSKGKNLVFFEYEWGDTATPTRLTFAQGPYEYDVLKDLQKRFTRPEAMWNALADKTFDAIYIIMLTPIDSRGFFRLFRGFRPGQNHDEYYSFADNYRIIKNRSGVPCFLINKLDNSKKYYTREITSNSLDKEGIFFSLTENEQVDFVDIPGKVKEFVLKCGIEELVVNNFKNISYDHVHLTFDSNSLIEIFNNFKFDSCNNNIIELAAEKEEYATTDFEKEFNISPGQGQNAVAFVPGQNKLKYRSVVFDYDIGFPVKEVLLNVPYFLFNDSPKENQIMVQWRHREGDTWKTLSSVKSNGTERYDTFTIFRNPGHLTGNLTAVFKPENIKEFQIRYLLRSSRTKDQAKLGIFTTYWQTSNTRVNARNFLRITIDTSELKPLINTYKSLIEIKSILNDLSRHPGAKTLIGLGTKS